MADAPVLEKDKKSKVAPETEAEKTVIALQAELARVKALLPGALRDLESKSRFAKSQCICGRNLIYLPDKDIWQCPAFLTGEVGREKGTERITCQRYLPYCEDGATPLVEDIEVRAQGRFIKGKAERILRKEQRHYYIEQSLISKIEECLLSGQHPGFVWFRELDEKAKAQRTRWSSGIRVDPVTGKPGPAAYMGPGEI